MIRKGVFAGQRLRGLYAITPDEPDTARLIERVGPVLMERPALLQYRAKSVSSSLRFEQAQALVVLCRRAEVPFIVNDDMALAVAVEADGVHLGRDDGDIAAARTLMGEKRILGVSCYNRWECALDAVAFGADYVAFGALFSSSVKPEAVHAPLTLLTRARQELNALVVGIGGITRSNVGQVIEAGADLAAVISDVFDAPDPGAAAQIYHARFQPPAPALLDPQARSGSQ